MSNMAVGDAICNMLMIESVLKDKDFSIENFNSIYKDLPNKTLKIEVKDRSAFKTTWDETELIQPLSLQSSIEFIWKTHKEARCFVRPSRTEDGLHVYVEAYTSESFDIIATAVMLEISEKFVSYVPTDFDIMQAKKRK